MGEMVDRYKSIMDTVINNYLPNGGNYYGTKLGYARAVAAIIYDILLNTLTSDILQGMQEDVLGKLSDCKDYGINCNDYTTAYDATITPLLDKVVKAVLNGLISNLILEGTDLPDASEEYWGKIFFHKKVDPINGSYETHVYVCVKEAYYNNGELFETYVWKKLTYVPPEPPPPQNP